MSLVSKAWAEARDHYNQGWFADKGAAYSASVSYFHNKWGANAACATFTELAPEKLAESRYEKRTKYTWRINNNGSCPASGHLYVYEVVCLGGTVFDGNNGCITPWSANGKNAGPRSAMCDNGSNPINTANGNKYQREPDYIGTAQGHLKLDRHYNSQEQSTSEIGSGWTHTYSRSIVLNAVSPSTNSPVAILKRPDGQSLRFTWNGSSWAGDPDVVGRLSHSGTLTTDSDVPCPAGGMTYINENDETETYNGLCQLTKVKNRWGFEHVLTWNLATSSGGDGNSMTLDRVHTRYIVSGGVNQSLRFQRDAAGRIWKLITPGGETYQYNYDAESRLVSVNYPAPGGASTTRTYHYEDAANPDALTGITDENGQRFATYTYDSQGRAYISEHAGGAGRVEFTFNANNTTTVKSPLGLYQTHHVQVQHDSGEISQIDGGINAACSATTAARSFDSNGFIDQVTDFSGSITDYDHNSRGLETQRIEAQGTAAERKVVTSWHATWRLPTQIDVYNAANQLLKRTQLSYNTAGQLSSSTELDMQDPDPSGTARTTTYTYIASGIAKGFLQKVDGPRTDVTDTVTYGYSSSTGNLITVTNGAGQVQTANGYDNHGRLTQMTDMNGAVIVQTWHPRGWLLSRSVDGEVTTYAYDNVGQLTRVTLPTGAYTDYAYDAAHRLVTVSDSLGNSIHYTLDAAGNRTVESIKDAAGALRRQITQGFDNRGLLGVVTTGVGDSTAFTYDGMGRLQKTIDPRDANLTAPTIYSEQLRDALGRVTQQRNASGGFASFNYDALDNLQSVTDERNVTTTYANNGFGNAKTLNSPDSGTTSYAYDRAGNLIQRTDARGISIGYQYDALNRVTRVDYPTDMDVVYTYDETASGGPGAKGRLTTLTDETGTSKYQYDRRGNVIRKDVTLGGTTYTTQYAYNGADQLVQITYPSGMVVGYTRNSSGLVTDVLATTSVVTNVLSNVQYAPFGAMTSGTYGNGLAETRSYDLAGRLTGIATGPQSQTFGYDVAGNITQITDSVRPVQGGAFSYDLQNRLTSQTSPASDRSYSYDAGSNRTQLNQTSSPAFIESYVIAANSNRLSQWAGLPVVYDAAGNQTSDPAHEATYNEAGRLHTASVGGVLRSTRYYNGLGQRVVKNASPYGGHYYRYFYDEAGQLLGEAVFQSGSLLYYREYVWLEGRPLAQLINVRSGATWVSSTVDYIHSSQINRPLFMTDSSGAETWRWVPVDAFGEGAPNPDVDGNGQLKELKLGFPGQYQDEEVGLWYNYFRDYDPGTGRYIQSDPIGLEGGINTYAYVVSNPLRYVDPYGLDADALVLSLPLALGAAMADSPIPGPGDLVAVGILVGALVTPGSTPVDGPMEMAAPGNVADSQIVRDYGEAAAAARQCGGKAPDKCEWLEQNKHRYRADQVKATQKAWGCRRSRHGR